MGRAARSVAGATSRVAAGATGCCADAAPTDNNATQPITAANEKFLIRELKCMIGCPIWVVCLFAVTLGATPLPAIVRRRGDRSIDFLEWRVVIFSIFLFLLRLDP